MLDITVSEPEQHEQHVVNAYVDYKVSTSTDLARFSQHHFFVRRRFRDFQWLHEQLSHSFPGVAVPPLPQVDSLLKDDRFSPAFIQRRQAGLELFLRRVACHPRLSEAPALLTFLEAKMWELQTAKAASSANSASSSSSWMMALFDGTDASLKKMGVRQERADEERITTLRSYISKYAESVAAAAAAHHSTVCTQADAAADLNLLGRAANLLSQLETELSLPFTHMASTLDAQRRLLEEHIQHERVSGLSSMLAFNAGMAASLKTVLSNHDRALDNYQRTQALQDARVSELQAWQALQSQENNAQSHPQQQAQWPNSLYGSMMSRLDWIMDEPKKGARLEEKVRDAKEHLAESKQVWDDVSSSIHTEADSFKRTTRFDLARALRDHVQRQIELEAAQQQHWRELLTVFESVPDVFEGSSTAAPGNLFEVEHVDHGTSLMHAAPPPQSIKHSSSLEAKRRATAEPDNQSYEELLLAGSQDILELRLLILKAVRAFATVLHRTSKEVITCNMVDSCMPAEQTHTPVVYVV